jgi:hypothetical protein
MTVNNIIFVTYYSKWNRSSLWLIVVNGITLMTNHLYILTSVDWSDRPTCLKEGLFSVPLLGDKCPRVVTVSGPYRWVATRILQCSQHEHFGCSDGQCIPQRSAVLVSLQSLASSPGQNSEKQNWTWCHEDASVKATVPPCHTNLYSI